jgi:hypothetical protein
MQRISKILPATGQTAVRVSGIVLLVSMLISSMNVYATLAAPANAPYTPNTVTFQGQLLDGPGSPVNGLKSITFRLYDEASGINSPLWTETQSVQVTEGVYSIQLGAMSTLPSNVFDGPRWLGVTVAPNPEMAPRIPISAVPFALNANSAQGIQGYPVSTATPTAGQILTFNTSSNSWGPTADTTSSVPSVRVYNTANIPTSNNAWKTLNFSTSNNERWDIGTLHNTSPTNANTYLSLSNASQAGTYFIFATVEFAQNNKNQRYIQFVYTPIGGSPVVIAYEVRDAVADGPTRMTLSTVYRLNQAGDKVEVQVKQNRGGNLNIMFVNGYSPEFGMIRIGD